MLLSFCYHPAAFDAAAAAILVLCAVRLLICRAADVFAKGAIATANVTMQGTGRVTVAGLLTGCAMCCATVQRLNVA
jgi:hypothetical protein